MRGARRYWWLVLALWAVGTAGIGVGIYLKIHPSYRASCMLRVDPSKTVLYGEHAGESLEAFMQTQVQLITSSNVLTAAATNSAAGKLVRIQNAGDVVLELRKVIQANIVPGTYLLEISMTSPSANECSVLVNAVVDAYMESNNEWSDGMTRMQIKNLEVYLGDLKSQSDEFERRWRDLKKLGDGDQIVTELVVPNPQAKAGEPAVAKSSTTSSITMEIYRKLQSEQYEVKFQLAEAEAWATASRTALEKSSKNPGPSLDPARIDQMVLRKFKVDPEVVALTARLTELRNKIDDIKKRARNAGDPAENAAWAKYNATYAQYEELWTEKSRLYREEFSNPAGMSADPEREIREADHRVATLRVRYETLKGELANLQVKNKKDLAIEVDLTLIRENRESLNTMQEAVKRRLEQLKFDSKGEARVRSLAPATPPGRPIADKRMQYLAMTPVGVLGAVLGLIVLLEIRSGRVADTDLLSSRVRNEVFSIAPLPDLRAGEDANDEKAEQRLARFVQSLDHLRVALCEGGVPGEGRCVMITSATGGEGKTTLSAHLAARCANAGTSTLLIDADMRRASLGRLLDVPVGLGLGDVLAGEAELDSALITVQAGGFHFLSAGTPGRDPSRVLKSERLAELIGRLRRTYDLVLIDTPPVLPVADALIMGRWADGAVMAARYDTSRLPLVERANRQLSVAGIPVLGVVVNGARGHDTSYGNYAYSYSYPGRSVDSDETITA